YGLGGCLGATSLDGERLDTNSVIVGETPRCPTEEARGIFLQSRVLEVNFAALATRTIEAQAGIVLVNDAPQVDFEVFLALLYQVLIGPSSVAHIESQHNQTSAAARAHLISPVLELDRGQVVQYSERG